MNRSFARLHRINAICCSRHTGGLWFCNCVHEWGVRNEWLLEDWWLTFLWRVFLKQWKASPAPSGPMLFNTLGKFWQKCFSPFIYPPLHSGLFCVPCLEWQQNVMNCRLGCIASLPWKVRMESQVYKQVVCKASHGTSRSSHTSWFRSPSVQQIAPKVPG